MVFSCLIDNRCVLRAKVISTLNVRGVFVPGSRLPDVGETVSQDCEAVPVDQVNVLLHKRVW